MATGIFHKNFPQVDELQEKVDEADYIIGLDLHKKTTAITVVDVTQPDKPIFGRKRLKNIELVEVLRRFPGKKVVIAEAAYGWFPLRRTLRVMEDVTFVLFDPRKTSAWIQTSGIKNDRIDSEVLAYACIKGGLAALAVYMPSEQCRDRFKLVILRDRLVGQRTQVKNQLKAIDRDYGVNPYTGEVVELSGEVAFMQGLLKKQLGNLNKRVKDTELKMTGISKKDPVITLLRSIPHIGPITAFALRNKMENTQRFQSAKHLCSYFGFGIRQKQSGDGNITGKLTKRGNTLIRKLLMQGAQGLRSNHPEYVELYFPGLAKPEQMKSFKHANKVAVATARKNLTFAYRTWKTGEMFDINTYRERREEMIKEHEQNEEAETNNHKPLSKNPRRLKSEEADADFSTVDLEYALGSNAGLTV